MSLVLFNTKDRKKETFKPLLGKKVGLYSCGPTVYNFPHIGNYRAYVFVDILKRYLAYSDYQVNHIMNITDVDDKTIKRSQEEGSSLKEFTEFYTEEFLSDLKRLNILPANKYPRATRHIKEIVNLIQTLLDKGYAYKSPDGSIYFDIKKFKNYGQLSKIKLADLKKDASERTFNDEYEKADAKDFALWKAWEEKDGPVFWKTKLGKGRPGWHIECSAMSMKYLGEKFDIHTGGIDLVFPHHENEIAQSEAATGKEFVKYWLHNDWLLVDGKKMSKSLGNFYTLNDLIKKDFSPLAYRYLLLTSHYRSLVNFTLESLTASSSALKNLHEQFADIVEKAGSKKGSIDKNYQDMFKKFMDNDLETPAALALAWELLKDNKITPENKKATLLSFDKVLGLNLDKIKPLKIPDTIKYLVDERELARQNKDWAKADLLRAELKNSGYEIKDTPEGPKLTKI